MARLCCSYVSCIFVLCQISATAPQFPLNHFFLFEIVYPLSSFRSSKCHNGAIEFANHTHIDIYNVFPMGYRGERRAVAIISIQT